MAGTVTSIVMVRDSFYVASHLWPSYKPMPDTARMLSEDGVYNVGIDEGEVPAANAVYFLQTGEAAPHTVDGNLFGKEKE